MWRLANYIFRAFRTVATHRCPQDIIVPVTTVYNKDEESNREKIEEILTQCKSNIHRIIKNNQFSSQNLEKLQEYLQKISYQQLIFKSDIVEAAKIEYVPTQVQSLPPPSPLPIQQEETLDSLLKSDEACMNTLKSLTDLNSETMSIINNQLAIEALETDDKQMGIEILQTIAKDDQNAAALYNLGICYERGLGVEQDRAKACDYYRQAAILGHTNAQFNLTILSNRIDDDDDEEEKTEQTKSNKLKFHFSFIKEYQEQQSSSSTWNDYHFNLTKTLSCLS